MSLNQSMFGLLMQAASGGGNFISKSGTLTLSAASPTIDVTTGESGLPFLAVVEKSEPIYNEAGVNLCMYVKLPLLLDMNQPTWLESNGYVSIVGESRTTYSNYCNALANGLNSATNPFSEGITFRCRNNTYPFFAGEYRWYALYGDAYEEG